MKNCTLRAFLKRLGAKSLADCHNLPYTVECIGLDRIRTDDCRYEYELGSRVNWLKKNCSGRFDAGPLRDDAGNCVGRTFYFEREGDALIFKERFADEIR